MKIIQIRGINGSGKTTLVRGLLDTLEYENVEVFVNGKAVICHKSERIFVIGRYDKNECGGCDASIENGNDLKELIAKVTKEYKPEILIFEGVMYGKTFSFTYEIFKYSQKIKAEFIAICLEPSFETVLQRIYERNGGKDINIKSLESGWKGCIRSNDKLKKMGVPIIRLDTGKMIKHEMESYIRDTLYEV